MQKGDRAIIDDFDINVIPLKLVEMGCLPGNTVEVLQFAPFGDPILLDINDSQLAIRLESAKLIKVRYLTEQSQ